MASVYERSFRKYLSPGEHTFTLENPLLNNPNLLFKIPYFSIIPDYYNETAVAYNLESDTELQNQIVSVDFQAKVQISETYENELDTFFKTIISNVNLERARVQLHSLSSECYESAMIQPPLVLDYFILEEESDGKKVPDVFTEDTIASDGTLFYGEEFKKEKHAIAITGILKSFEVPYDIIMSYSDLNSCIFPTLKDFDYEIVRCRLHLGPFMHLGFSNKHVLLLLGFTEEWIQNNCFLRNKQYWLQNSNTDAINVTFIAPGPPRFDYKNETSTRVYLRLGIKKFNERFIKMSDTITKFSISKKDINDPNTLANTLNDIFSKHFKKNFNLKFQIGYTALKYNLIFPTKNAFIVNLYLSNNLTSILGYDFSKTDGNINQLNYFTNEATKSPITNISEIESLSKILVYNTGLALVTLPSAPSIQTFGSNRQVISLLKASDQGILESIYYNINIPFSQFEKDVEFLINEYSYNGNLQPLNWPRGYYIQGILVGQEV